MKKSDQESLYFKIRTQKCIKEEWFWRQPPTLVRFFLWRIILRLLRTPFYSYVQTAPISYLSVQYFSPSPSSDQNRLTLTQWRLRWVLKVTLEDRKSTFSPGSNEFNLWMSVAQPLERRRSEGSPTVWGSFLRQGGDMPLLQGVRILSNLVQLGLQEPLVALEIKSKNTNNRTSRPVPQNCPRDPKRLKQVSLLGKLPGWCLCQTP